MMKLSSVQSSTSSFFFRSGKWFNYFIWSLAQFFTLKTEKNYQKNQNFDLKTNIWTHFDLKNQNMDTFWPQNQILTLRKPKFGHISTFQLKFWTHYDLKNQFMDTFWPQSQILTLRKPKFEHISTFQPKFEHISTFQPKFRTHFDLKNQFLDTFWPKNQILDTFWPPKTKFCTKNRFFLKTRNKMAKWSYNNSKLTDHMIPFH